MNQKQAKAKSNKEWETFTPPPAEVKPGGMVTYELEMYVDNKSDEVGQTIELTREEFIELKRHLAETRGLSAAPRRRR